MGRRARRREGRRTVRRGWWAVLVLALLLVVWPLTYRYTSVGIDLESGHEQTVAQTFYRVRWPGNGSMLVGVIEEHRDTSSGRVQRFDLGAEILRHARPPEPRSVWNRLGFWWVHTDAAAGDPASDVAPHADRVWFVGVPHWLLVLAAAAAALRSLALRRRQRKDPTLNASGPSSSGGGGGI